MSKDKVLVSSLKPYMDIEGLDVGLEVVRKRFSSRITIDPSEDRTCVANITTTDEDAEGDVIIPTGADLKRFTKNPVIMYAHNYSGKPVAKAVALSVNEEGITAKMKFAETEEANDVWSLIKGGFLNANSIGFIIKERFHRGTEEFNTYVKENKIKVKDTVDRIISKFELLESSIVPIPCNPEALMVAVSEKSINLSEKTLKELDLPKVIVVEKKDIVEEIVIDLPEEIIKSPACRQKDETKEDCVARKIPEIIGEGVDKEQAIAMAYSMCDKPCEEKSKEFKELVEKAKEIKIEEPKRSIKVIRSGGYDIKKLVELRKLAIKGKVV